MKKLMKNLDIRHILLFVVAGLLICYFKNRVDKFSIGAPGISSCVCKFQNENGQCYKNAPIQIPNGGTIYQGINKSYGRACGKYKNLNMCGNDDWCTWEFADKEY